MIKVFIEEPVGLEVLAPDDEPDARRRTAEPGSLEALLARGTAPDSDYARAYLAGTHLGDGRPQVGLTAVVEAEAWLQPLLTWAGTRTWSRLHPSGEFRTVAPAEAADALRQPGDATALALGPVSAADLARAAAGARRDALPALRSLLDADASVAVFFPEPAHDGQDWSLFGRRPLRAPLADAFRQHPAPQARRLFAPYQRARGEHTFYIEQWGLDALPDWAERV